MNNMASIFIDPARFGGAHFAADLEAYAEWMKAAPPAARGGEVLLPGEVERRTRDRVCATASRLTRRRSASCRPRRKR